MTAASHTIKAVVLMEKDVNGEILTWTFPSIDKQTENVMKARSGLQTSVTPASPPAAASSLTDCPFRFSKFQSNWLYQLSVPLTSAAARQHKVESVSIGVVTSGGASYYPVPKYQSLLQLLLKAYTDAPGEQALSPLPIMQVYLDIFTTDKYSGPFGSYDDSSFDPRRAMLAPLKQLVQMFGADCITIWMAMLLKKRVLVYHPSLQQLLPIVQLFPVMGAWHRQDPSVLRPFLNIDSESEVADLKAAGVYVAGVTDANAVNRRELYDLFVDAQAKTFQFGAAAAAAPASSPLSSPTAASTPRPADFTLLKFHRTTADSIVAAAADPSSTDQSVIKSVAALTKDLLDQVAQLKAEDPAGAITREGLEAAGLPAGMQAWIYGVATAEGLNKK